MLSGENAEYGKGYTLTLFYVHHSIDHTLKNILSIFLFMSISPIQYILAKDDGTASLAILLWTIIPALTMVLSL